MADQLQGPFEKFVDSPYYSESLLFSKYLPWQETHFYKAPPTSRKCVADRLPQAS
jgi:hypothetical protein